MYYNGTDFILNPKVYGDGEMYLESDLNVEENLDVTGSINAEEDSTFQKDISNY